MKHGVINVYKEAGMTSFQVVYQIRKITGEKKAGHTGTLDPDATGVLPVCIGKATKLVEELMGGTKEYRARMRLGVRTDTQDLSGTVIEEMNAEDVREKLRQQVMAASADGLTGTSENDSADFIKDYIKKQVETFVKTYDQLPPMYSAVKVGGVKLVDAARKGKEIERKARPVTIYGFSDICVDDLTIAFTVSCSKGTYVRTLCEDIGASMGIPASLETLERTRTSCFTKEDALTLDEIRKAKEEGRLEDVIWPIDQFLTQYPELVVKDETVRKILFGNQITEAEVEPEPSSHLTETDTNQMNHTFRIYDRNGRFYALYDYDAQAKQYKCRKMFVEEGSF